MGFAKEEAIKALKAAFNNPDRAIDYLINGIPETEPHPHSQGGGLSQPISQPLGGNPLIGGGLPQQTQGGSEAFSHLLNNPQFQMVRNLIRQNPQMLQGILLQLQQSNPDLFTVITQNQEAFTRWLTEGSQGGSSQQQNVIQVTPEEKEAIDRLVGLGFEKQAVIQAYLVCDKNEELAANLLFDQMNQGDFDEVLGEINGLFIS